MSKASFYGIHANPRKRFGPRRRGEGRAAEPLPSLPEATPKRARRRPFWLRRVALARAVTGR